MNITFEEANKIRQALQPGAKQNERYEAIGILDTAEQKQREKNAKTIKYIQNKRKADKNYARPKTKAQDKYSIGYDPEKYRKDRESEKGEL